MQKLYLEQLPELVMVLTKKIEQLEIAVQKISLSVSESIGDERLLTVEEASTYLRLTKNTLYGLVSKSRIPVSKRGKRLYFLKEELEQWVAEGRRKTSSELAADAEAYLQSRYAKNNRTNRD